MTAGRMSSWNLPIMASPLRCHLRRGGTSSSRHQQTDCEPLVVACRLIERRGDRGTERSRWFQVGSPGASSKMCWTQHRGKRSRSRRPRRPGVETDLCRGPHDTAGSHRRPGEVYAPLRFPAAVPGPDDMSDTTAEPVPAKGDYWHLHGVDDSSYNCQRRAHAGSRPAEHPVQHRGSHGTVIPAR